LAPTLRFPASGKGWGRCCGPVQEITTMRPICPRSGRRTRMSAGLQAAERQRADVARAHHVCTDCRLVEKDQAGGIKQALLSDPRPPPRPDLPARSCERMTAPSISRRVSRDAANGLGVRLFFGRAKEFGVAAARRRSISFDCFSNGRLCVPGRQGHQAFPHPRLRRINKDRERLVIQSLRAC
jgi:hypothetical protein